MHRNHHDGRVTICCVPHGHASTDLKFRLSVSDLGVQRTLFAFEYCNKRCCHSSICLA